MNALHAAYERLLAALGLLAGLGLAVLALMISVDIVLRNIGVINFPWLLEVSEYVLYVSTFLAAPWVLRQGAHVRVDVFVTMMPAAVARLLELVADLVGLAISLVFLVYAFDATYASFARTSLVFKELVILEWPLLAVMPFASILLAVEFVRRIARTLRGEAPQAADGTGF